MSTFCVLPWNHLATHPDGRISLCCESRTDLSHESGKRLSKDSIADAYNSEFFRRTRLEMLSGKKPEACANCFLKEERGVESKRLYENKRFDLTEEQAKKLTRPDGKVDLDLKFVELRLGNLCNLKCRSCAPHSSSKWVGEYEAIQKKVDFLYDCSVDDGFKWPERAEFWDDLIASAPNLELLYINGGEPLLSLRHWKVLEKLAASGRSKSIKLDYSTNMTVFHKKAAELWPHFERVTIRASIDDVGARNAYIRYKSDWKTVEETTLRMRAIANVHLHVLQTVSAMNFFYLPELYEWAEKHGIYVTHNYVRDGEHLRPDSIPLPVRLIALERAKTILPERLYTPLEKVWSLPAEPDPERAWLRFVQYTRALDKSRSESFRETFPEFSDALARGGWLVP